MTKFVIAVLVLLAGCNADVPVTMDVIEGSFDGTTMEIHQAGADVVGSTEPLLPILPSTAYGTGGVPTGVDYIALVQGTRVTEADWDRANCGRVPAGGVCAQITMQNMYTAHRVTQAYVEFTSLSPSTVTFVSNANSNASRGVSNAIGLMSYGRLARAGRANDHTLLYWVFRSTTVGPIHFTFRANVKANLI